MTMGRMNIRLPREARKITKGRKKDYQKEGRKSTKGRKED